MYHQGLTELAQIREQESMRESLRRAALRDARREAGVTWLQLLRSRFFGDRGAGRAVGGARPLPSRTTAVAAAARPTPSLRVIGAAEVECPAGADC